MEDINLRNEAPEAQDNVEAKEDGEINLIDVFAILWRRKVMIIVITAIAMVGVVVFSIVSIVLPPETSPLPNRYTSYAYVLITDGRSPAGARETLLGYGAGFARRDDTYSGLAMFLLRSNTLLDSVVDTFNRRNWHKSDKVLEKKEGKRGNQEAGHSNETYKQAKEMGEFTEGAEWHKNDKQFRVKLTRGMLRSGLGARFDRNSRVLIINFTHIDPVLARDVLNLTVAKLEKRFIGLGIDRDRAELQRLELNLAEVFRNILLLEEERRRLEQAAVAISVAGGANLAIMADINRTIMAWEAMRQVYTQLRVQQEVLRVNIAVEIPMFQILELAEVPAVKSEPSRLRLCIIVTFAAGLFSVFLAFVLAVISNIRKDPVAMAKLRGTYAQA